MKHNLKEAELSINALNDARELYESNQAELEKYLDLLLEWNEKINLVSRTVSRETLKEHIVHSLIPASAGLLSGHDRWIDTGTGGGLPGIPLAICLKNKQWILNDNVKKKMRAVSDIVERLGLDNVEIAAKSISLIDFDKGTGIVTKHAFKIDDLLRHIGSRPWKTILMWKGAEHAKQEVLQSKKKLNTTLYSFNFGQNETFYEGKAILKIYR